MDIEQMNISGLIRFFLFSAMPPIVLSIIGGWIASMIIKSYRKRKNRTEDDIPTIADQVLHGETVKAD